MLLAWAVLATWICGCLTWIVLLVITLQLPQGSSSTSCAAGKSHPWCYFPAKALRSLQNTRKARPKGRWSQREGFQQREGSLDAKSPQRRLRLSQLHFLSSQQQLPVWLVFAQLGNTRAGLAFWYPETVLFGLLQLWYIFCIEDSVSLPPIWKPLFFVCPIAASLRREELLWPLGAGYGHFLKMLLIIPQNSCLSFIAYSGQILLLCYNHVRQGIAGALVDFAGKAGDNSLLYSSPSSLLCPPPAHHTHLSAHFGITGCWKARNCAITSFRRLKSFSTYSNERFFWYISSNIREIEQLSKHAMYCLAFVSSPEK